MLSLYERFKAAGVQMANHYSDLYVPSTEQTLKIVREFKAEGGIASVSAFRNQLDPRGLWLDIAFSFDPYWETRGCPHCVSTVLGEREKGGA